MFTTVTAFDSINRHQSLSINACLLPSINRMAYKLCNAYRT